MTLMAEFDINYEPSGKPLTDKTWADYPQALSPRSGMAWDVNSDLARQLYKMDGHSHLRYQEWRLLLGAAVSGLPVVVTWDTRLNMGGVPKVERKTRTMVVPYLMPPSLERPSELPVRVRASYSGFGHDIRATDIREVAPPPTPPAEFLHLENSAYVRTN